MALADPVDGLRCSRRCGKWTNDWYVIAQIFVFGLLLGWLRWASGSTILTILLHALINAEGMLETVLDQNGSANAAGPRLEQRGDAGESRMLVDAARQPRQADDADAVGKARDAGDGVVELDRVALALAHHDGGNLQIALSPARRAP